MKTYQLSSNMGEAVGTDNIKLLSDESEQRIKLLETIKAVAKAVYDKHLKRYGSFDEVWSTTKQMKFNELEISSYSDFDVDEPTKYYYRHIDTSLIKGNDIGVKFITMQALKAAYERVNVGEYAFGSLLIPEVDNMGFIVYLKCKQGRHVSIQSRYINLNPLEQFGFEFNLDDKSAWDYGCVVTTLSNFLENE